MFLFKKKKEVIGIDIGSSSVKVVQLKDNKGSLQLLNVGIFPLPPEAIVDNTLDGQLINRNRNKKSYRKSWY